MVAAVVPLTSTAQSAPAASSSTSSDAARRDALLQKLQATDPQIAAAERTLTALQGQLTASNVALATDNKRLVEVQSQMAANQQVMAQAKAQLAQMMRVTYVSQGQNTVAGAVFAADSFNQAFDRFKGAQTVSDQLATLLKTVDQAQAALAAEQKVLTAEQAATLKLESGLAAQSNMLLATVAARDQLLTSAPAPVVDTVAKIDNANNAIAVKSTPRSAPRPMQVQPASKPAPGGGGGGGAPGNGGASGPCGNHFAYGQCTWYVASRRCIPWFGSAGEWLGAARSMGYATGMRPAVGAVAVWYAGQGGASGSGHVAYVEAVGNGTYTVSEMNWNGGWGHVSRRTLSDGSPIGGFIYGKG